MRIKFLCPPVLLALAALSASGAMAQATGAGKTVVVEPVAVFNQWVSSVVRVPPEPQFAGFQSVALALPANAGRQSVYQPLPVILGAPELPLRVASGLQAPFNWSQQLNYQGVQMQQVVLGAAGAPRELRHMGSPLRLGERFKVRISATFDAVVEVDQVLGGVWNGMRTGQIYPQIGFSVQIKAGDSVDLPVEPNGYFVMDRPANERLVVSVRHPNAQPGTTGDQPTYRQDAVRGSSYLQLVPTGKYPAIEQLVSQGQ